MSTPLPTRVRFGPYYEFVRGLRKRLLDKYGLPVLRLDKPETVKPGAYRHPRLPKDIVIVIDNPPEPGSLWDFSRDTQRILKLWPPNQHEFANKVRILFLPF